MQRKDKLVYTKVFFGRRIVLIKRYLTNDYYFTGYVEKKYFEEIGDGLFPGDTTFDGKLTDTGFPIKGDYLGFDTLWDTRHCYNKKECIEILKDAAKVLTAVFE